MLHKNIPIGDIHYIHNWEVANEANRLALVVTTADRGKLCWQLDTNEFFFLASGSPVSWLPAIGIQGPQGIQGIQGLPGLDGTNGTNGTNAPKVLPVACSDEISALILGTNKITFRMPYAMTVNVLKASLTVAQVSGNVLTIDIKQNGVSILSTLLTIDNTEKTSVTATTPVIISNVFLIDDAEITIDITQIGDGTAKGLKIYMVGV